MKISTTHSQCIKVRIALLFVCSLFLVACGGGGGSGGDGGNNNPGATSCVLGTGTLDNCTLG